MLWGGQTNSQDCFGFDVLKIAKLEGINDFWTFLVMQTQKEEFWILHVLIFHVCLQLFELLMLIKCLTP